MKGRCRLFLDDVLASAISPACYISLLCKVERSGAPSSIIGIEPQPPPPSLRSVSLPEHFTIGECGFREAKTLFIAHSSAQLSSASLLAATPQHGSQQHSIYTIESKGICEDRKSGLHLGSSDEQTFEEEETQMPEKEFQAQNSVGVNCHTEA